MSRLLLRASQPWQASQARKSLAGLIDHELIDGVRYQFDPRIEYDEASEPMPWLLVADPTEVLLDAEPGLVLCGGCGGPR